MNRYGRIWKFVSLFAILASLSVPVAFALPGSASAGLMEWTPVKTPDITQSSIDNIYSPVDPANPQLLEQGSEIIKLLVGSNGLKMYAIVRVGYRAGSTVGNVILMTSGDGGRVWTTPDGIANDMTVFDAAVAPDDSNAVVIAVSTKPAAGTFSLTQTVLYSTGGANSFDDLGWSAPAAGA